MNEDLEDWYEDADGDFMPASPEAWDQLFDEAEAIGAEYSVLDGDDSP